MKMRKKLKLMDFICAGCFLISLVWLAAHFELSEKHLVVEPEIKAYDKVLIYKHMRSRLEHIADIDRYILEHGKLRQFRAKRKAVITKYKIISVCVFLSLLCIWLSSRLLSRRKEKKQITS